MSKGELLKLLSENLSIKVDKTYNWTGVEVLKVSVCFDGEIIASDYTKIN